MKTTGSTPLLSVWFASFPLPITISIADASSCRVSASCLLSTIISAISGTGITLDGCKRALYCTSQGYGQLLNTGASVAFFQSATNQRACCFDPTNSRLAVLTANQLLEISPSNWKTAWVINHGITIGSGPCSIDVNRNGTIAIAGAGTVALYAGSTGASAASLAVFGANSVRFDATGNIYVGGTSSLAAYNPALTSLWSISQPYTAISIGDQSLFCQRDTSAGSNADVRDLATGNLIGTAANCSSLCAIPKGSAIGIQNALASGGPTICRIEPSGSISHQGDRITAWNFVSGSPGSYTRTGPTLSEPSIGRIGAYSW